MMLRSFPRFLSLALALASLAVLLGAKLGNQNRKTSSHGYALELLWWPEYCHEHPKLRYCAGASFRGFVPRKFAEMSSDGQIQSCTATTRSFNPDTKLLSLLPDEALLRSQWDTHGACSGLSQGEYFDRLARAFKSVAIPRQFVSPDHDFRMSPDGVKQAFLRANRDFSPDGFLVFCRLGFLSAIQIQRARSVAAPKGICDDSGVEVIARMPLAE
jgi:ribonuclease T2